MKLFLFSSLFLSGFLMSCAQVPTFQRGPASRFSEMDRDALRGVYVGDFEGTYEDTSHCIVNASDETSDNTKEYLKVRAVGIERINEEGKEIWRDHPNAFIMMDLAYDTERVNKEGKGGVLGGEKFEIDLKTGLLSSLSYETKSGLTAKMLGVSRHTKSVCYNLKKLPSAKAVQSSDEDDDAYFRRVVKYYKSLKK